MPHDLVGRGPACSHGPSHEEHRHVVRGIAGAFFLNISFAAIEFVGGLWTQSVAIMSDALHDLGDSASLALAWYLERASGRGADPRYSYGYRRLSLLSAVVSSIILVSGSVWIAKHAIERLIEPVQPYAPGMMGLAVLGILVNGIGAYRLSIRSSHSAQALRWHLLEDVAGWVSVLITSIVMTFADLPILDPILSLGFMAMILRGVYRNLNSTLRLLLQATPPDIDLVAATRSISGIPGIIEVHDLHLWSLDGEQHVLTVHIVLAPQTALTRAEEIKCEIRRILCELGRIHATIEIETPDADCPDRDCARPCLPQS